MGKINENYFTVFFKLLLNNISRLVIINFNGWLNVVIIACLPYQIDVLLWSSYQKNILLYSVITDLPIISPIAMSIILDIIVLMFKYK